MWTMQAYRVRGRHRFLAAMLCCIGIVLMLPVTGFAESNIPSSERQALLDFYYSTNGSQWMVTEPLRWPNADQDDVCRWFGVQCNLDKDHVTGISLAGVGLSGTLPASITQLSYLEMLSITNLGYPVDNTVGGTIPSLQGMMELKFVSLTNNSFTGPFPSVQGLPKLKRLDIGGNALSGPVPSWQSLNTPELDYGHLCPNHFTPSEDPDWDYVTGTIPWYLECTPPPPVVDPIFGDGFE